MKGRTKQGETDNGYTDRHMDRQGSTDKDKWTDRKSGQIIG